MSLRLQERSHRTRRSFPQDGSGRECGPWTIRCYQGVLGLQHQAKQSIQIIARVLAKSVSVGPDRSSTLPHIRFRVLGSYTDCCRGRKTHRGMLLSPRKHWSSHIQYELPRHRRWRATELALDGSSAETLTEWKGLLPLVPMPFSFKMRVMKCELD